MRRTSSQSERHLSMPDMSLNASVTLESGSPNKATPATVRNTILICDFINQLKMSPKEFMVTFLSSTHEELIYRQRLSKIGMGARQTRSIFRNLARLTSASNKGRDIWENLILDEASRIVNDQEVTRGAFPTGAFVSSSTITPDFFSDGHEAIRTTQIQSGMKFLHALIQRKIAHAMNKKDLATCEDDEVNVGGPGSLSDEAPLGESQIEGAVDEATVLSMENLVAVKSTPSSQAAHKLAKVPTMVCAMIAVTCNRRCNAIPVANGLMTLASGVSCRVNEWLHALGLTTSRTAILQALEHFPIPPDTLGLPAFLEAMRAADRRPVNLGMFTPSPAESQHWRLAIKAQLSKCMREYIEHLPGGLHAQDLPALVVKPPEIDPIAMHKPNIHFLRMMDAPDSSAEGVSRVLDQIMGQIGLDNDAYSKSLLIAGGDVGSNQLVESLRVKRHPAVDPVEGLSWVLSVFGGAHTNWNFTKALWTHHWGQPDKAEDTGVWRSAFSLGLEYKKPVATQDFNTVMRSCHIVHKANMVFVLKSARVHSMHSQMYSPKSHALKTGDRVTGLSRPQETGRL
ncbi:uncharacterized protein MELLADRAFT_70219 [Melampsora larici-populina 98AG31]|uniref:DUF6589 domain-containing protein n=1 Tax=Melampsora larici-populina (strain 98AG31 / pathotype 3-4-7) TaxID=747676 RepID=F4SE32_MELLP|nr:uncharacterized protein MELLADRAFT_70219 [Melampsora larici-populina 98AG31]EGF97095.1 hypothetical protein MELLADRAFT_70219 [Melampsora larici-populina 98AG31]